MKFADFQVTCDSKIGLASYDIAACHGERTRLLQSALRRAVQCVSPLFCLEPYNPALGRVINRYPVNVNTRRQATSGITLAIPR